MSASSPYPAYLTSASELREFPSDRGREVAFAGRSNSGKSTALNLLLGRRGLARTSKTPGRTQMINFFALDPERRVVDLPGYGYAKVSDAVRERWQRALAAYFETRRSLVGLVLTVDVRRGIQAGDRALLEWLRPLGLPSIVLLTKADKLARAESRSQQQSAAAALADYEAEAVLFSARTRVGVVEARARLDALLAGQ